MKFDLHTSISVYSATICSRRKKFVWRYSQWKKLNDEFFFKFCVSIGIEDQPGNNLPIIVCWKICSILCILYYFRFFIQVLWTLTYEREFLTEQLLPIIAKIDNSTINILYIIVAADPRNFFILSIYFLHYNFRAFHYKI